ncbi:hypothetical protein G6F50_016927 [Rhizopus delemar]|uniref:Uncharacterized protein n=1 Tax=Rhizopus delemar TaxID=936053 RepID=A0A9P7C0Y2_9FUNG|nr:hypothetical protein G6F50_016927 [Rhizopus delemar]
MLGLPQGKPAGAGRDDQALRKRHVTSSNEIGDDDRRDYPEDGQHEKALKEAQARFGLLGINGSTQTHGSPWKRFCGLPATVQGQQRARRQ